MHANKHVNQIKGKEEEEEENTKINWLAYKESQSNCLF